MTKASTVKKKSSNANKALGRKAAFPRSIEPMLATLVDKPFESEGWIYEIKWDGYRALSFLNNGKLNLLSRNHKSFNEKFYPIYEALLSAKMNVVFDGEIVVLNEQGVSDFGSLQNWRSESDGDLIYYVFDILWLNGYSLMHLPLLERKEILKKNLPKNSSIRLSEAFDIPVQEFLSVTHKMGLEGIMAKKESSEYIPGTRSKEWLKIKSNKRHEVVIGGFTQNEGSSKLFSSLLVGVYERGKLNYIGKIGTGFDVKMQKDIMSKLKPLVVLKCPFTFEPDVEKPSRFRPNPPKSKVTWVKPNLVCEVSYTEITRDGIMRHPSFEGMRIDKDAKEVHRENAKSTKEIINKKNTSENKFTKPVTNKSKTTLLNPSEESQVKKVNGHEIHFTNLGKIFWPKEKYTKRDMLNYYYQVSEYILPYLKDRPQSLNRYPNGISGKSFYQKDITNKSPDWIKMEPYRTSEGVDKNFLVPTDEASILYMANLGAIEMNPWNSTIKNEDYPDWCLIDLDPSEKTNFEKVIEAAKVTKEVLDHLGIVGYPKTSGSTGIHIYIPLGAKYNYDQCQLFAKLIATQINHIIPEFTSIERLTKNREQKLYVDYLQNRPKATLAAPYSLRPKPGAPVSMPLYWEEVKKGLKIIDFNISNAIARIKTEGDIFKPVLGKGINLERIMKKF